MSEFDFWDFALRRRGIAGVGRGHPAAAVLRYPGKKINALSVDDGARTTVGLSRGRGQLRACAAPAVSWSRCAIASCCSIRAPNTIENLTEPVDEPATNRLNDGKVGPDGCFWVGSMDERSPRQKTGALYRVTPHGRIETQGGRLRGVERPRLVAGRTHHVSLGLPRPRSSTRGISMPRPAACEPSRVCATLSNEDGRPDGAAMDMEGNYWSAGPSAACINRFSPSGQLLRKLPFPVPGRRCRASRTATCMSRPCERGNPLKCSSSFRRWVVCSGRVWRCPAHRSRCSPTDATAPCGRRSPAGHVMAASPPRDDPAFHRRDSSASGRRARDGRRPRRAVTRPATASRVTRPASRP